MPNNPFFSIVIPAYNKEKYISRCVLSVLNQSFSDFEVLIIDDGSTDRTPEILESFKSFEIVKWHRRPNSGVSFTRNFGVEMSSGSWIVFLDADDYWFSNHLQVIFEHIMSNPMLNVFSTSFFWGTLKFDNNIHSDFMIINDYLKYSIGRILINSSTVAIRKEEFENFGGFDTGLVRGEDLEFWLRLLKKNDLGYINSYSAVYSVNESQEIKKTYLFGRSFLQRICNGVIEIKEENLRIYAANYLWISFKSLLRNFDLSVIFVTPLLLRLIIDGSYAKAMRVREYNRNNRMQ